MKALVTGGAGFIGSNLVDLLIENGHDVTVIDNESAECNDIFYWNSAAKNYKENILNYKKTRRLYDGIDIVFHLAAEARIQPCIINPLKAVKTNILGTANVLQCSRESGVKRIIYSSTSSAYGLKNTPPLSENMINDCLNPYSMSKVAGEEICKMYSKMYNMQTVIFRYFNVYGNRQPVRGQYATVTGIFMRQVEANEPMTVVGDGEQRRDFINVKDVAQANIMGAKFVCKDSNYEWGQIYNVGSGTNYSINQIADLIGNKKVFIPFREGEARDTLADITKIKEHFAWEPKIKIDEWIKNKF